MGGQDGTDTELTDNEIVAKLKRILQCLESEEGKVCKKMEEGDNWFGTRKERLRVPQDQRKEELKLLLDEKMKKKEPETVINTFYPTEDKDKNETVKQDTYNKTCNKADGVREEIKSNEYPSQTDMKNLLEYGLLQGPYLEPFLIEMTMGRILTGCQCIKRNGLQGDCKKKLCRGKNTCVRLPLPLCVPSGYGRLKPREAKIYMGEIASCPKEEVVTHVKAVSKQKKREPVRKDYIDSPAYVPSAVCKVHVKGKYYIRPTRRNKNTQTVDIDPTVESPLTVYQTCPPVETIAAKHTSA